MSVLVHVVAIGTGATLVMDAWGLARGPLLGMPRPDYRLLGRWVAHLPRGIVVHRPIAATPAVHGEHALGWAVHYTIGVSFAALLVALVGREWLATPQPVPALAVGIATVLAPLAIMQPTFGAGFAGRLTAHPWQTRLQSLLTHAVYGVGLYLSALVLAHLAPS